jgi:protein TonB
MATRVFLLSSDEKAVHAITQILDELEISFEHSSDAPFTLKRLGTQRFDLLIVDCDNVQTATQVFNSARASALNKAAIAIAIVEGKAGVPNAFRLGASLVLTKPVSLEQVRNTLRTGVGMTRKDGLESKPAVPHVSAPPPAPMPTPVPTPVAIPSPIAHSAPPAGPITTFSHPAIPAVPPVATVPPIAQMPVPAVVPPPSVAAPAVARAAENPPAPLTPSIPVSIAQVVAPVPPAPAAPKPEPVAEKPVLLSSSSAAPSEAKISIDAILEALPKPPATNAPHSTASSSAAAAAPALSKTESLSSILASLPATDAPKDSHTKPFQEKEASPFDLPDPSEDSLGEDSAASLRASAVPAFGGLSKQPFAGLEPPKRSRIGLIVMGTVVVLAGSATAAWFLKPQFRSAVLQKYGVVKEQVALWRGHSASVATPSAPVSTAPVQPAPAPEPAPATSSESVPAAASSAAGTSAATAPSAAAPGAAPSSSTPGAASTPVTPSAETSGKVGAPVSKEVHSTHPVSNPPSASAPASSASSAAATAHASDILEVPEDYADDQVIHRVRAVYPKQARGRKLQGTVVLQAIVDKKGKVNSLQLVSGDPVLAQAAADAVKQWRYKPYSHNGDPAEFQTRITVEFHPTAADR